MFVSQTMFIVVVRLYFMLSIVTLFISSLSLHSKNKNTQNGKWATTRCDCRRSNIDSFSLFVLHLLSIPLSTMNYTHVEYVPSTNETVRCVCFVHLLFFLNMLAFVVSSFVRLFVLSCVARPLTCLCRSMTNDPDEEEQRRTSLNVVFNRRVCVCVCYEPHWFRVRRHKQWSLTFDRVEKNFCSWIEAIDDVDDID
jgi:hypothetical protein